MNAGAAIRIAVPILAQYGNSDRAILRAWLLPLITFGGSCGSIDPT